MYLLFLVVIQQIVDTQTTQISLYNQDKIIQNALLPADSDLSYKMIDDCVYVMYEGEIIGTILSRSQFNTYSFPDSFQTIWLPDTQGGVVNPAVFVCNPLHEIMYIMGREQQNISVCDRQTGERLGGILTGRRTMGMAYSETTDKLYCASSASNIIEVIDGATHAIIKIIQIQDQPNGLVWNSLTNEVYCSHEIYPYVSVIDCVTDSLIINIPVGGSSTIWSITYNPLNNKIYCPCHCAPYVDSVYIIDGDNHVVTATVLTGGASFFSTINTIHNKVYFASCANNTVTIIDGNYDSLIAVMPISNDPFCLDYNTVMDRVYIGHRGGRELYVLDGATDTIIEILHLGTEILSMSFDSLDNRLFCSLGWEDIAVFDCSTHTIIDWLDTENFTCGMYWDSDYNCIWVGNSCYSNYPTYTIHGFSADSLNRLFRTATGFTPYKACLHGSTNKLFSVGSDDIYLAVLDMDNPSSCVLKAVGRHPFDMVINTIDDKIYCPNRWGNTITALDAFTDSIIAQIPSWQEPVRLAFNQPNNKIYCANLTGNTVTVVDGVTNQILDTIPVGTRPTSILWNSIDNKIYVGNSTDCTITIIDASVDTVIATLPSGRHHWAFCHDVVNDKIYSAEYRSDNVTVIDGVTNQVVKTLIIARPLCLAHNPFANRMYCACDGPIYVIDCENDSIINTISIGNGPHSLLYNPITNTLFCAYCHTASYPWKDALVVIDCDTDSVIARLVFETQRWYYGLGDPKDALVLDSLNNIVYFTHYTSSKISVLDGATGVCEGTIALSSLPIFNIYPNPAKGNIKLLFSTPVEQKLLIKLYDVSGRLVNEIYNGNVNTDLIEIPVKMANLAAGVYFIRLETETNQTIKKVILLR